MDFMKRLPRGFYVLFFVMLLTTAALSLIQGLLALFCINYLGFSNEKTYLLYAAFSSMIFATPLLGGYVGGRFITFPLTIILGMTLSVIGLYLICFNVASYLYIGLATFTVGNGMALTCLFVLLGRIFPKNDPMRVSGFTFCYAGMNIGALTTLMSASFIAEVSGYQNAFIFSAVFILTALLIFILGVRTFVSLKIDEPTLIKFQKNKSVALCTAIGIGLTLFAILLTAELFRRAELNNTVLLTIGVLAAIFIVILALRMRIEQRTRLITFLIIYTIGVGFWSLYLLAPSVLKIFVSHNVNLHYFNVLLPPTKFAALNPLFVVVLGYSFSILWMWLHKIGKVPSIPIKFAIGILLIGMAYFVLSLGTYLANTAGLVSSWWIVLSYFFQSAAELLILPIGAAMIGMYLPKKYEGTMMGIWLLSIGIGGTFSVYLANMAINPEHIVNPAITNPLYVSYFLRFALIALAIAIVTTAFALSYNNYYKTQELRKS